MSKDKKLQKDIEKAIKPAIGEFVKNRDKFTEACDKVVEQSEKKLAVDLAELDKANKELDALNEKIKPVTGELVKGKPSPIIETNEALKEMNEAIERAEESLKAYLNTTELPPVAEKMIELNNELILARREYYQKGSYITMTDQEFDEKLRELKLLEEAWPEYKIEGGVTSTVGSPVDEDKDKITHPYKMLSLDNLFNEEDFDKFIAQMAKGLGLKEEEILSSSFLVEPKIDGLSVSLSYKAGKLISAATRGDGVIGEDITEQVASVSGIPKTIPYGGYVVIRGEIYMAKSVFVELNNERLKKGLPPYANPRNTAAGSIRLKDKEERDKRGLYFIGYEVQGTSQSTQLGKSMWLTENNIPQCRGISVSGREEILNSIKQIEVMGKSTPYDIDGAVIKLDLVEFQEKLGDSHTSPRWARAWKFETEIKETTLLNVDFQVSKNGIITPVAEFEPVELGGTTVRKASLFNRVRLKQLQLHIGDKIEVFKAGEIVPQVKGRTSTTHHEDEPYIDYPSKCPSCKSDVIRMPGKVYELCSGGSKCSAQKTALIESFVSKKAMDIDGFGPSLVEALVERGVIEAPQDVYKLTAKQLSKVPKMGKKKVEKLLSAIEASKNVTLAKFIHSFSIQGIGRRASEAIAKFTVTPALFEHLALSNNDAVQLIEVIGPYAYGELKNYFELPSNKKMLSELMEVLHIEAEGDDSPLGNELKDQAVVFSGVFTLSSRKALEERVKSQGGKVQKAVSSKTTMLVVGNKPSDSKVAKAKKLGVRIVEEENFLESSC